MTPLPSGQLVDVGDGGGEVGRRSPQSCGASEMSSPFDLLVITEVVENLHCWKQVFTPRPQRVSSAGIFRYTFNAFQQYRFSGQSLPLALLSAPRHYSCSGGGTVS